MKRLLLLVGAFSLLNACEVLKSKDVLSIDFATDKTVNDVYNRNKQIVTMLIAKKGIDKKRFEAMLMICKGKHPFCLIERQFPDLNGFMGKNGVSKENIKTLSININGKNGSVNLTRKDGKTFNTTVILK